MFTGRKVGLDNDKFQFFDMDENTHHLFVNCKYVDTIWHWIVNCQLHYASWNNVQDNADSHTLDKNSFLFIAICWLVWKDRITYLFILHSDNS